LGEGDVEEAWCCSKDWHHTAKDCAPKPCHKLMEKQTKKRVELYAKVPPSGDPTPINAEPFVIKDDIPEDVEIRAVVQGMTRNDRARGSKICTKDMKYWLWGMVEEEERGTAGAGVK